MHFSWAFNPNTSFRGEALISTRLLGGISMPYVFAVTGLSTRLLHQRSSLAQTLVCCPQGYLQPAWFVPSPFQIQFKALSMGSVNSVADTVAPCRVAESQPLPAQHSMQIPIQTATPHPAHSHCSWCSPSFFTQSGLSPVTPCPAHVPSAVVAPAAFSQP